MKTVTILMCLLIALAGCNGYDTTAWLYGDNDAVGARVGMVSESNVEVGVLSYWYPYNDNDSQIWGAYGLYHFPDLVDLPNPFGEDPNTLTATTYIGAQLSMDSNYEDYVSPVTGIIFQEIFFIEYQYGAFDNKEAMEEDKVVFGLRWRF